MYNMMDVGHPAFAVIFSLSIILIGSFFSLNLILASIINAFNYAQEKEEKRIKTITLIPQLVFDDSEFAVVIAADANSNQD